MNEAFLRDHLPLLTLLASIVVAVVVGMLVQRVGTHLARRLTRRFSVVDCLLRQIEKPLRIVVPLIFVQLALSAATLEADWLPKLHHGVGILLIAALTWLANAGVSGVAEGVTLLRPTTAADNLAARQIQTQARVIAIALKVLITVVGLAAILMTFPAIRALGASLLASAGLAGIVAGLAARPVLGNLIAGMQIALSQPIRLDDVVIIEGEWGRIEEITGTYVVVAIWDERRLVVPLQWIIENPFQNWTRRTSQLIGTVYLWVDYRLPLQPLREELERLCQAAPEWDGRLAKLQVTDANERAMQVRALVTAGDSGSAWDLRCSVREGLIAFVQQNYPENLPRLRASVDAPTLQRAGDRTAADDVADNGIADSGERRR